MNRVDVGITAILIALLASVTVPNLRAAKHRSRQKRTMADMRTIAQAWEARATDTNSYTVPPDDTRQLRTQRADFQRAHVVSGADLQRALSPTYVKKLPLADGWGNAFEFRTTNYRDGAAASYAIRSIGRDRDADRETYAGSVLETDDYDADVVFSDGNFVEYPGFL